MALLLALAQRMIPEGECDMRAKSLIQALMRRSDFSSSLAPDDMPPEERQARLAEFKALYEQAGLNKKSEEPAPAPAESAA
jgi:hypothetical protein